MNIICKISVITSQRTQRATIKNIKRLMLCREVAGICCEDLAEHTNALCWQNVEFLCVRADGTHGGRTAGQKCLPFLIMNGSWKCFCVCLIYVYHAEKFLPVWPNTLKEKLAAPCVQNFGSYVTESTMYFDYKYVTRHLSWSVASAISGSLTSIHFCCGVI